MGVLDLGNGVGLAISNKRGRGYQTGAKYQKPTRLSPSFSANSHCGEYMRGRDGDWWFSKPTEQRDSAGLKVCRWVRFKAGYTSTPRRRPVRKPRRVVIVVTPRRRKTPIKRHRTPKRKTPVKKCPRYTRWSQVPVKRLRDVAGDLGVCIRGLRRKDDIVDALKRARVPLSRC